MGYECVGGDLENMDVCEKQPTASIESIDENNLVIIKFDKDIQKFEITRTDLDIKVFKRN